MTSLIKVELSKNQLEMTAGSLPDFKVEQQSEQAVFEVDVVNASQRFASFQVELILDGISKLKQVTDQWYRVEPRICAKKPPGAHTRFRVVLEKAPIPVYERAISIQVRVISVEFEDLQDTQSLELTIRPPQNPIKLYLPFEDLRAYPGDRLLIPVIVSNLRPEPVSIQLSLMGESYPIQLEQRTETAQVRTGKITYIQPEWFVEGCEKVTTIPANDSREIEFCCYLPALPTLLSQAYYFTLQANYNDYETNCSGQIELLPYGTVQIDCPEPHKVIICSNWQNRRGTVQFPFQVMNNSNLSHQVRLQLVDRPKAKSVNLNSSDSELIGQPSKNIITAEQNIASLPAATDSLLQLEVQKKHPWLGWNRRYWFSVIPKLNKADSGEPSEPIYPTSKHQTVELTVKPILPIWLQISGGLVGLLVLALVGWLNPRSYHVAPVNSVRLIGNETTVVSGSSDQTLRRWDVSASPVSFIQSRLWHRGLIAQTDKAIRVVRESPFRDGQIAVGLESGDIELWEVTPPRRIRRVFQGSDRIFDLDFTADARYLFSGHGSGLVRQWNLQEPGDTPLQQITTEVAVSAVSVLDTGEQSLVAIAGQYNTLLLWDWQQQQVYQLDDSSIGNTFQSASQVTEQIPAQIPALYGKGDYINSLATTDDSRLLAVADNRGTVSLWNTDQLLTCIRSQQDASPVAPNSPRTSLQPLTCEQAVLTQWQVNTTGQAVRSVALSEDGCYLATAGDNGQLKLWSLGSAGLQHEQFQNGTLITRYSRSPIRSVDMKRFQNHQLLIVANGPSNNVNLYRHQIDQGFAGACSAQPTTETAVSQHDADAQTAE